MSGVRDVPAARQGAAFGEALRKLIESRGFTVAAFMRKAYGQNPVGKPKGSGQLYPILNGTGAVTINSLKRYAAVLDVPVEQLVELRNHPARLTGTPAARPVAKLSAPAVIPPAAIPPAAKPSAPEQFSLVIDQEGAATLRLNLVGVPVAMAMRAMAALTGAGLIKSAPEEG